MAFSSKVKEGGDDEEVFVDSDLTDVAKELAGNARKHVVHDLLVDYSFHFRYHYHRGLY